MRKNYLQLKSFLVWNDCNTNLPPINTTILFSFSNEVHIGYMDEEGYFFSSLSWLSHKVTESIAVAIADHLYEEDGHVITDYWLLDKEEGDYSFVNRWISFDTSILPKIQLTLDKLDRVYLLNKDSEWEINDLVYRRVANFLTELYEIDEYKFTIPTIISVRKSIYCTWSNPNTEREVSINFNENRDELYCKGYKFNHTIFPFDPTRLIPWLDWLNK